MTKENLLEVEHLAKRFGDIQAVNGVSFAIEKGECFGLLGPNGAGKTTTLEIIEGIMDPTSGSIRYKGNPRDAAFREEIGIQFQQTSLLSFLTVRETLETFRKFYQRVDSVEDLMALCHLKAIARQYNDRISGGQRQRLLLALALVNRPELLFLDEPSTGLDPQARRKLWQIVQNLKGQGNTIVLTTHYMEEAQFLCDRVAIMDKGNIVAMGTTDALIETHGQGTTVVLPVREKEKLPPEFLLHSGVHGDRLHIHTDNINACLEALMTFRVDLAELKVRSPNLEDVFLNLTGRKLRD